MTNKTKNILPLFAVLTLVTAAAAFAHNPNGKADPMNASLEKLKGAEFEQSFLQQIEDRMRYYGSLIGVAAGEPFYVREALNVDDPFALLTRPMNIYS